MNENLHLINCVANDLNCEYLSDLHAPHLLNSIKKIIGNYVAEDFTLLLITFLTVIRYLNLVKRQNNFCSTINDN